MTDNALPRSKFWIKCLLVAACWVVSAAPSLLGQAAAKALEPSADGDTPYKPTMTFDVAAVRENKQVDPSAGIMMGGQFAPHTTRLKLLNFRLESLLAFAYGVDEHEIVGAPKWPYPTVFVIEASGDSDADAKLALLTREQQWAEQKHMLQALLEDRFNLKTHWETRDSDIYNLVVAKGGPKLGQEGSLPPSDDDLKVFGNQPVPVLRQKNDGRGYDFIAHGCSTDQLARMLKSQFGRPVIDKTELTGKYDFVLKYRGRWDRDRPADDPDPTPPMDRALQEELGLKVEAARGTSRVLVVDHVEKPSQN